MNNFPDMTEAQRQALIDFMQGSRTYRYEEWSRLYKLRDQIALAALTAKSIAWIETGTDGFLRGSRLINYFTSDIQGFDNGTLIYAAPRAPVLRVPEWTNEQCLEFLSIAFRHAEISGDIEMDDIRLGIKMVNAAAPEVE